MAHQSTPDVVDFACQTVADLTVLPRTALSDGCRSWVSAAGATHGLWCLDDNSAALVDNLTVVATSDGVGRWIYFGFAATPAVISVSVDTEALLSAVNVVALLDGVQAWVGNPAGGAGQSQDSTWQLITQVAGVPALAAHEVIASSVAGRVWQRLTDINTPRWMQQANWYIDPAGGNDQNDGSTNITPLNTFGELARRLPSISIPIVINYVGSGNPAQALGWNPTVNWDSSLSATITSIQINGVETPSTLPVNATGVVNSATNGTAATNTPPRLTDTGGAGVVWPVGTILRVTSGASVGAWCCVLKDEGAGVARTSIWQTNVTAVSAVPGVAAPPVNGNTYQVVVQTTFPDFKVAAECAVVVTRCKFTRLTSLEFGTDNTSRYTQYTYCVFPATITGMFPLAGSIVSLAACFYGGGPIGAFTQVNVPIFGCGIASSSVVRVTFGARCGMINSIFQGHGVHNVNAADSQVGGQWSVNNVGFFDCAEAALVTQRQGQGFVRGALWGSGNATQGVQVRSGGRVSVKTGITPTLASIGQELELENIATGIQCIAGIPTAPAVPLASWANWNAAVVPGVSGFARNVVSYLTGASIIDSA